MLTLIYSYGLILVCLISQVVIEDLYRILVRSMLQNTKRPSNGATFKVLLKAAQNFLIERSTYSQYLKKERGRRKKRTYSLIANSAEFQVLGQEELSQSRYNNRATNGVLNYQEKARSGILLYPNARDHDIE